MLLNHLFLASLLPHLQSDPPAGGGGNPPEPPTADPPLGEKGEKALQDERDARREADKRAKAAEKELADLKAAKAQADDEEAKKQGEWQKLAETREADLTKATTDLESATSELDVLRGNVTADIKAAIKDLPKALLAFDPGEDASIADRLKWLATAKANAADLTKETKRGAGFDPPPTDRKFTSDEDNRARAAMRPRL